MSDVSDEAFMKLGGLVWPGMLEDDSYSQCWEAVAIVREIAATRMTGSVAILRY